MSKVEIITGLTIAAVTVAVLSAAIGFAFGVDHTAKDLNKFVIPFLSMVGAWVSGLGALVAVVTALKIANHQTEHEQKQDAVRCIHHALAIINDLRCRVGNMRLMLTEGNRPILSLTKGLEAIEKRYEALYDRDIYRHAPGEIVDEIADMSGSFFGLSVLVSGIIAGVNLKPHELLPPDTNGTRKTIADRLLRLENQLDELFRKFLKLRQSMDA